MLTCKEIAEFLSDYLERALPWRQRLRFRLHLLLCRDCRRYLDSYQKTREAIVVSEEPPSERAAPPEVVQAILAARGKASRSNDDAQP